MRMVILALLVFVLAGISLGLSRLGITELVPQMLAGNGPQLTFEVEPDTKETSLEVDVLRARPDGVMMLTRSNVAQTAHFQLPQDAGLVSGVLELNLAAQISDDQNSLLRVLVGNQTRGEVLLRPGQRDIKAEIGLTSDDLAGDALAVRYALVNPADDGACTVDGGWSNVIEVEQDSRLVLQVDEKKLTPRDQVAAWGNVVLIGWPGWLSEAQRQDRWFSAMQLAQRGFQVRFVDAPDSETLSGNPLAELIASDVQPFITDEIVPEWPEYVAQVGGNAGKRAFQRAATWRHWYRIGPKDHQSNPTAFAYEMMLGPLPNGAEWTIVVTHNGSIIDAETVPGRATVLTRTLSLREADITHSNVIEITATSGYEPTGLCNNGPQLYAELRPDTRLIGGGTLFDNGIEALKNRMNQRQPVTLAVPEDMSLVEAQRMLDLIQELVDKDSTLQVVQADATLSVVRRTDYADDLPTLPETAYVVWFDDDSQITATPAAAFKGADPVIALGALAVIADPLDLNRNSLLQTP
ncbi:hypothetical protein SAMN04488515_2280 [Cognatiyoonia koreensis]|uniref:Cellulose synthase regulatory subunit n=1 Tax=Cognatiyoonia koreensis TaxID=364200 RepID=A0A1I0QXH0_9RHOB|nr:hypothetical protein [Cognatiyoonia koreensis]SEW32056.1 hypothetical protein SAMN04488515_2280 [Cognatiyoonia koreensis]